MASAIGRGRPAQGPGVFPATPLARTLGTPAGTNRQSGVDMSAGANPRHSSRPGSPRARRISATAESLPQPERSSLIMLLGRRDEPTDAVHDYVNCLGEALGRRGIVCENSEVRWDEQGWMVALAK